MFAKIRLLDWANKINGFKVGRDPDIIQKDVLLQSIMVHVPVQYTDMSI